MVWVGDLNLGTSLMPLADPRQGGGVGGRDSQHLHELWTARVGKNMRGISKGGLNQQGVKEMGKGKTFKVRKY